jgi:hypothetical protein
MGWIGITAITLNSCTVIKCNIKLPLGSIQYILVNIAAFPVNKITFKQIFIKFIPLMSVKSLKLCKKDSVKKEPISKSSVRMELSEIPFWRGEF